MSVQSDFDIAFEQVIGEEGGYVNDPHDPGGETNFGISKRAYPALDITGLTMAQAKDIYRRDYWTRAACDRLPLMSALPLFDAAVNMGVTTAVKLMQEALGEVADGAIGPRTRAALQREGNDPELVVRFQAERALYYAHLSGFGRYGKGWMRRVIRTAMAAVSDGVRP